MNILMECGHSAQGYISGTKTPVCVICYGVHPGGGIPAKVVPNFEGRKAKCSDCGKPPVDSKVSLAFFKHRPDCETDSYYCGCRGWD